MSDVTEQELDSLSALMVDVAEFRRRHPGFVWPFTEAWREHRELRRRLRRISSRSTRVFRVADELGEHRREEEIRP